MALSKINPRVWAAGSDGLIEVVSLTQDRVGDAMDMMRNYFFKHEKICTALDLHNHPAGISEMEDFTMSIIKQGISVIAVEKATGKIAGCAINKIDVKKDTAKSDFIKLNCKNSHAKAMLQALIEIDETVNIFDLLQTDCVMEVMFGATRSEFRKTGVGSLNAEACIKIAQKLKNGENIKTSIDGKRLPLHPIPTGVITATTTLASKQIFENFKFIKAGEVDLHERKSLDGLITSNIPPFPIMFKSLK